MKYYEIKNKKTLEQAQGYAKNMMELCKNLGWRPQDCKCVYNYPAK